MLASPGCITEQKANQVCSFAERTHLNEPLPHETLRNLGGGRIYGHQSHATECLPCEKFLPVKLVKIGSRTSNSQNNWTNSYISPCKTTPHTGMYHIFECLQIKSTLILMCWLTLIHKYIDRDTSLKFQICSRVGTALCNQWCSRNKSEVKQRAKHKADEWTNSKLDTHV